MTGPTLNELLSVACTRCGAKPGDECTFVAPRVNGARRGESMGGSCHSARYDALEAGGAS